MKSEYTKLIELLINSGADVNAKDKDGKTALMYAFDAGVADVLINAGADVKNHTTEPINIDKKKPKTVVKIKPNELQKQIEDIYDAELKNGDPFGIKDLDKVLFKIELSTKEVLEITELQRRATLYRWMNDSKFPRQKKLYSNHIGWNVLEVWEWASKRPGNREKARLVKILKKL